MIYWLIFTNLFTAYIWYKVGASRFENNLHNLFKTAFHSITKDVAAGLYPNDPEGLEKVKKAAVNGAFENLKKAILK